MISDTIYQERELSLII